MGAPAAADGRGQIKRLILSLGMGLLVSFLVTAQSTDPTGSTSTAGGQGGAASSGAVAGTDGGVASGRVDESTLVLGEPSTEDGGSGRVSPFSFWDLARMVLVLGIVVAMIYGVFYLLKRAGNGKFVQSELIRVVGSQSLPGNRAIYLVQVGPQVFMVGAGGDSLTLLGEITDRETIDTMVLEAATATEAPRRNFGDLIASLVRSDSGGSLDLMRQQRERLQRLRQ